MFEESDLVDENNPDVFRMVQEWKEAPKGDWKDDAASYLIGYLLGSYLRERKRTQAGLRMRQAQQGYFLGRRGPERNTLLRTALEAERQYDALIAGVKQE